MVSSSARGAAGWNGWGCTIRIHPFESHVFKGWLGCVVFFFRVCVGFTQETQRNKSKPQTRKSERCLLTHHLMICQLLLIHSRLFLLLRRGRNQHLFRDLVRVFMGPLMETEGWNPEMLERRWSCC